MANSDHCGYIYYDSNFIFKDGTVGNKLFVVLCVSPLNSDNVVVVRTTSKNAGATSYGCHLDDRWANFHVPAEAGILLERTWIKLDYVVEYGVAVLDSGRLKRISKLGPVTFKDLLLCAAQSVDIENDIRQALSSLAMSP